MVYGAQTPSRSRAEMEALTSIASIQSVMLPLGKLSVRLHPRESDRWRLTVGIAAIPNCGLADLNCVVRSTRPCQKPKTPKSAPASTA
jgi:hypothetical protein